MAMQSGLSGYTDAIGSGFMKGRFRWVEKYDVETNTSDITIYPQFKSTNWYGYSYYFSGSYDIDGTAVVSMTSSSGKYGVYVSAQNTWLAPSVGATSFTKTGIVHNADGSRSVTLRFNNVRGYNSKGNGGSGWTVSGSVTITLTNIPRGSTVSATDANVGAVSTLVVNRSVPSAVHSIQYALGSLSGYVTAAGGVSATEVRFSNTTVNWTVPTAFFAQMPNASSAKCTLTIRTYQSGGSQIGEAKSAAMTVTTTQAQSGPTVSGTVTDVNEATVALTGSSARLVKGHSTARAAITAAARNSASIRSRTVNGTAPGAGGYVDYAGNTAASFVFAVTDSRGFSASATVKPQMVDYVPLSLAGSCTRPAPTADTATLALSGNFFNASFGAVDNAISVRYRVDSGADVPVTVTLSGNTWSASVPLSGMPYTNGYTITVTAADKLTALTRTIALNPGVPVFDWGKNDFRVNVPLSLAGGVEQKTAGVILDAIKTVDGSGSGLDADALDGLHASSFYTRTETDKQIASNFERGTWTPQLYDGYTFRMNLPVSPWFRIGDLYIALCSTGYTINGAKIEANAEVHNLPFTTVVAAAGFARYDGAKSMCDSFQGSSYNGAGSVLLRNMDNGNKLGTFGSTGSIAFVAFGYR